MIGIIHLGMGNIASVRNALDYLGLACKVCLEPREAEGCNRLILPGVGAFPSAVRSIKKNGWDSFIRKSTLEKKIPFLGICLGMQLMLECSHELEKSSGLGLIKGSVESLSDKVKKNRLPHMGWNNLNSIKSSSKLLNPYFTDQVKETFYFVHNFYCKVTNPDIVTARCNYEFEFDAVFEKDNLFGCQFHPEKSQNAGFEILKRFSRI
jgi:glutamine amidotransferase